MEPVLSCRGGSDNVASSGIASGHDVSQYAWLSFEKSQTMHPCERLVDGGMDGQITGPQCQTMPRRSRGDGLPPGQGGRASSKRQKS